MYGIGIRSFLKTVKQHDLPNKGKLNYDLLLCTKTLKILSHLILVSINMKEIIKFSRKAFHECLHSQRRNFNLKGLSV